MSELVLSAVNPCLSCGACCAHFRVSFYWAEAEASGLPADMVVPINSVYSCMAGTERAPVRCAALQGKVGTAVSCGVYAQRTSPCREVQAGDVQCARARRAHGLAPVPVLQKGLASAPELLN